MKDLSDFCPEFQEAAAYYASLNTPSDQAILVEFLRRLVSTPSENTGKTF